MIALIDSIVGIILLFFKYFLSPTSVSKREQERTNETIQEIRKAIDSGDPDKLSIAIADQHDRVQQAIRGR